MSNRSINLTDELYSYMLDVSLREPDILHRLRDETARDPMARMQIAPEQGQLMQMLVRLLGARRCIEVGVFTGYSSLAVAMALPADGRLVACDVSEEWTAVARRYWKEAGVEGKVDLRIAPAAQTLDALLESGEAGSFDFGFIDADKESYDTYYERCLDLLRPGGLLAIDNVFRNGAVVDPPSDDTGTQAIDALNRKISGDDRVDISLLPIADGLTLVRKK